MKSILDCMKKCSDRQYIVLGVAFGWGLRKGLDVFIKLSKNLGEAYQIVIVGTDEQTDANLPANIISVHRTQNQQELAELYSMADVFVNPTREDNFPTTNIEAIACGAPVITYDVGGSKEMIDDTCGVAVPAENIDLLEKEIIRVCTTKPYTQKACVERSKKFDMNNKFKEYVSLFEKISEDVYSQERMELK